jgi:hypothetical protein
VKNWTKWTNKNKLVRKMVGKEKILGGKANKSTRKSVNKEKTKKKWSKINVGTLANKRENK